MAGYTNHSSDGSVAAKKDLRSYFITDAPQEINMTAVAMNIPDKTNMSWPTNDDEY